MKGNLNIDGRGTCKKCRGSVWRLKLSKTWHHINDDDYRKCGYVEIDRGVSQSKDEGGKNEN